MSESNNHQSSHSVNSSDPQPEAFENSAKEPPAIKEPSEALSPSPEPSPLSSPSASLPPCLILCLVLLTNFLSSLANFYVFDFPQSLAQPIQHRLKVRPYKLEMLYTAYALPNLVFTPLIGIYLEKVGLWISSITFAILIIIGQGLCLYGIMTNNYWYLIAGRAFYGVGGEGNVITFPAINEYWFRGKILSFANGILQASVFSVMLAGNYFSPKLFIWANNLELPFQVFLYMCLGSFAAVLVYSYIQINCSQYRDLFVSLGCNDNQETDEPEGDTKNIVETEDSYILRKDHSKNHNLISDEGKTHKESYKNSISSENGLMNTKKSISEEPPQVPFGFKAIFKLSRYFWMLSLIFLFLSNAYFQLTNITSEMAIKRFGSTYEKAQNLTILVPLGVIVGTPIISLLLQLFGKKALALTLGSLLLTLNYLLMYSLKENSPLTGVCFFMVGMGYSVLQSTIHVCVAIVVPSQGIGMAYSLLSFIENFGLITFPMLFSIFTEKKSVEGYNQCIIALGSISAVSFLVCLVLYRSDITKNRSCLDLPENNPRVISFKDNLQKAFEEEMLSEMSDKSPSNKQSIFSVSSAPASGLSEKLLSQPPAKNLKRSAIQ